ncbi:MAG: repair protein RecN [Sphingobacterium sp.]|jgi:DNA repair protein RecN (Recombination protein N)|uniref:DNA repair protein RecN n=1 Tax=unclassified Sphingobacterium TaxID=2609468 RepID=UPI0009878212|nr:DNA repair protein RecN [Sphingobacterium sp. CZ-UAM]MDF2519077.1 repair protein RecN [Sphingobacterium sp.]OOG16191.1 DNA repair protein RecN [Sphingobacterium sp. CZ-UAM]
MLDTLHIKNYALINVLEIQFDKGLNMITGETGAGKSIIMGALSLILGNRAEGKHFFDPSKKCVIEGEFNIGAYQLNGFFEQNDLDYADHTIIRREITPDGKSRAFVNDSPVTLAILKQLGEQLIDVHSQHATLQVNTEEFQFLVVDSVAGSFALKQSYKESYTAYKKAKRELEELKEAVKKAAMELDYFQFQFDELDGAKLVAEEQAALEQQQRQLENAEDIKRALNAASHLLENEDTAILTQLKDTMTQVEGISSFLPEASDLSARLKSTLIELKDVAAELASLEEDTQLDEGTLLEVNERLSLLYSLQKKHHVDSVEELIRLRDDLEAKLLAINSSDEQLERLEAEVVAKLALALRNAKELSEARKLVLDRIAKDVQNTLSNVGMPNAVLQIVLEPLKDGEMRESGIDTIQFLFSANKGQDLQSIHRVASGGELSRVMLAIKSLVAKTSALPTIVFDEIDTGISGEVALRVGEVMENLAENMQVIAISHLPQIASKGAAHFKVYKEDQANRTISNIVRLDQAGRVKEIAQMLSGANPTDAAVEHAELLLKGE